jgi:diadenosine tetraphosphate (Ap4A) HIT family hydrolase
MNATLQKFGDPETRIARVEPWVVLLRPQQVTLGALVLVCEEPAHAFSELSTGAFEAVRRLEEALYRAFEYDKINYLMLMMVDPDVHFHVIPRYAHPREAAGRGFEDTGWPGPPDLSTINPTDAETNRLLRDRIRTAWQ